MRGRIINSFIRSLQAFSANVARAVGFGQCEGQARVMTIGATRKINAVRMTPLSPSLVRGEVRKPSRILLVLGLLMALASPAVAGPINSDVAFTPRKGGTILRLQYLYGEADANEQFRHQSKSVVRATVVQGFSKDVALFLTLPYVNVQTDRIVTRYGRKRRTEDTQDGLADLTLLGKFRFWQKDYAPLHTARWAGLVGLNVRSGDADFTSDSYDPIVGTVFTWRRDRNLIDADLIYQFNTGRQTFQHDTLRYDLAYTYRIFPAKFGAEHDYQVDLVAEVNGRYRTDGSHEVFLSPGVQLSARRVVLELSIQLPAIQNLPSYESESDYRLVMGVRFVW